MKKLLAAGICAICAVCLAGSTGYAATNPFMDVPLNHWSYDAIGALAARGVLSGYPDGTYKGRQPTTRYEMASAVACALAVVDMTKADKRDVEMLKKLVVDFADELEALGVRVDQLDKRLGAFEGRLGGWKLSGELRMDIEDWDNSDDGASGATNLSMGRLEIQRWFGEDEGIFFYARLELDGVVTYDKFYADIPFFWDSTLTVGRFDRDFEGDYRFQIGGATDIANEAWLTDRTVDGIGIEKSFALGTFNAYVAHPGDLPGVEPDTEASVWEAAAMAQLQFTERFAFDVGAQVFFGDDSSVVDFEDYGLKVDNLWTLFAGLRFDFNPNIALRGLYYYQDSSIEENSSGAWRDVDTDSVGAWKVIIDVKQDLLKFTSLWLEYDQLEAGFYLPYGNVALTLPDEDWGNVNAGSGVVGNDTTIWRVGATQQWNDKWSTWLYAAGHTLDDGGLNAAGAARDAKLFQWGVGAEYQYNESVAFALGYIDVNWNGDAELAGYVDDHRIQFRTRVSF